MILGAVGLFHIVGLPRAGGCLGKEVKQILSCDLVLLEEQEEREILVDDYRIYANAVQRNQKSGGNTSIFWNRY